MGWQTVLASETDANSPLSQTLMDKIRQNLDYLYQAGAQIRFLSGYDTEQTTPRDIVIDDSMDWRDRYFEVLGNVTIYLWYQECLPGGAHDDELGSPYDTISGIDCVGHFRNQWLYSAGGSPNSATDPYIEIADLNAGNDAARIWVRDSDGALMLTVQTARSPGYRNAAWNLRVIYSEKRGGH